MTSAEIEKRLMALEQKVANLAADHAPATNKDWVLNMWGSFSNDPDFEEAMRLGRKWRESENRKSLRSVKPARARKSRK
jgi:hypothetical protein